MENRQPQRPQTARAPSKQEPPSSLTLNEGNKESSVKKGNKQCTTITAKQKGEFDIQVNMLEPMRRGRTLR